MRGYPRNREHQVKPQSNIQDQGMQTMAHTLRRHNNGPTATLQQPQKLTTPHQRKY